MQTDSDAEINELRTAALLSKPTNMRKRKVSLTNKRKILVCGNDGDKREVVHVRHVVIGARSGLPTRIISEGATVNEAVDISEVATNSHSSLSLASSFDMNRSDITKKARLENDERVFTVTEEKESTLIFDEKDEEGDTWQIGIKEDIGLKQDVRIVVNKNELDESGKFEEPNVEIPGDRGELDRLEPHNQVDLESGEEINGSPRLNQDTGKDVRTEKYEEATVTEKKLALNNRQQAEVENEAEDARDEEEKEMSQEDEKDDRSGNNKNGKIFEPTKELAEVRTSDNSSANKESETNDLINKVTEKRTSDNAYANNKPEKEGDGDFIVNGRKTLNASEIPRDSKDANQTIGVTGAAINCGDHESGGSESDSSRSSDSSGSSSSSSSYSSSSDSSSYSGNSSGSDSDTDSDSSSRSRSRSASVSSSYSYSTNGSTKKKATLRSVVTRTNRSSRQRRPFSRSPSERRGSLDRRYTSRQRSYSREDSHRGETIGSDRTKRIVGSRYSRRVSPYRRRGRQDSGSPPRYHRRGNRNRSRSRESSRLRKSRYGRADDQQPRRPVQSGTPENNSRQSTDSVKNTLRTDDDFVEIDVKKESNVDKSTTSWIARKKTSFEAPKPGFDLRSRLASRKSDKRDTRKATRVEQQNRVGRNAGHHSIAIQAESVEVKSNKEQKLDARIERIRVMNEQIMKRQQEIEKEKLLYG